MVPRAPTLEESNATAVSFLRDIGYTDPRGHIGIGLVVHQDEPSEREEHTCPRTRLGDGDRCLNVGLGSSLNGIRTRGAVVTSRTSTSLVSGTAGSHICSESFHEEQEEPSHPPENGQQNCCVLRKLHGGTHSQLISKLAIQLWQWCLEKNLSLSAVHLPGASNVADEESRTIQSSAEWHLDQKIFCQIVKALGECNADLFATRLNTQLEQFVSWRPDQNAVGTDALQIPWDRYSGYAISPFCLIGRCLRKVREDRAPLMLIAPVWRSQPWYSALLELLVDYPRTLPSGPMLLTDPFGHPHPLMAAGQLQLAAWKLSGRDSKQQELQEKLHSSWQPGGAREQISPIKAYGNDGIASVLNNKLIPFHALSSPSLNS